MGMGIRIWGLGCVCGVTTKQSTRVSKEHILTDADVEAVGEAEAEFIPLSLSVWFGFLACGCVCLFNFWYF